MLYVGKGLYVVEPPQKKGLIDIRSRHFRQRAPGTLVQ